MTTTDLNEEEPTRRDFIHIMAGAVAAAGGAVTLWPLIHQMNPDASVLALATIDVDLGPVAEGQAIKVMWQGKPVFIRHRTAVEIQETEQLPMALVKDGAARNDNLPSGADATDENRRFDAKWMVVVGVCTHLGCIPLGTEQGENRGDYNGWFCPCHGSHYDLAGRIIKGPAPENLPIPPYEFMSETTIKIG
ncbi:MAG: ubiquinol-cytochrome c reductase iron-sulfur subunit [Pseudomonadota bacterium]